MNNVKQLGQVYTPAGVAQFMATLAVNTKRKNRILEPSAGNGSFLSVLPKHTEAIDIEPQGAANRIIQQDFFTLSDEPVYDLIIGNPPYVKHNDILETTKKYLYTEKYESFFDKRTNLFFYFIKKSVEMLKDGGELIFIVPVNFASATCAKKLNKWLLSIGSFTHYFDFGDKNIFGDFSPTCAIFRYVKGVFTDTLETGHKIHCDNGQLYFLRDTGETRIGDIFDIYTGAVSGADDIFTHEQLGNVEVVCSYTRKTNTTKRMILTNTATPYLEGFKDRLLNRKVRKFNESNWFNWGRMHHQSDQPRIYVNAKTRIDKPFFIHSCNIYDGSILALFPKDLTQNVQYWCDKLNEVEWDKVGMKFGGRYMFFIEHLKNVKI